MTRLVPIVFAYLQGFVKCGIGRIALFCLYCVSLVVEGLVILGNDKNEFDRFIGRMVRVLD